MATIGGMGFSGLDPGATAIDRYWATEDRDEQTYQNQLGAEKAMRFSSAEAVKNRGFQERMSNTSYQRATADMMAAGINPMLAFQQGGASSPSGGQGQGYASHGAPTRATPMATFSTGGASTAAQLANINAATEKTKAETKEVEARTPLHPATTREIEARTPTHAMSIEKMKQEIGESAMRIEKIIEETTVAQNSAKNIAQQTENLRQQVPQIQATIQQIRAATKLTTGQTQEIQQRIKVNLPEIERAIKNLEEKSRQLAMPQQQMNFSTHDSFVGALSALLRALNPLQSITNIAR